MSRHNRRRRRARHARHHESTFSWDSSCSADSIGSLQTREDRGACNYSVFWNNSNGANPWLRRLPADRGLEYLYRRGLPLPLGPNVARNRNAMLQRSSSRVWHAHDSGNVQQSSDCDSLSQGMTNVVAFLFDGMTDYDDEEIERKAASAKRHSQAAPVGIRRPHSISYSMYGGVL